MKENTKNRKITLTIIAVLLIVTLILGGTIAWLTSTSKLNNTFTVGQINPIDPTPVNPGPGPSPIPEEDKDGTNGRLNGNLYEPHWIKDSLLIPSAQIEKDPYVGIGPNSEESYIYVYVKNTMKNNDHVYFDIDTTNWEEISGHVTKTADSQHYIGGLFRYKTTLTGKADNNTWTETSLFKQIKVADNAVSEDFTIAENGKEVGAIQVFAYIHQAKDANKKDLKATSETAAINAIPSFTF